MNYIDKNKNHDDDYTREERVIIALDSENKDNLLETQVRAALAQEVANLPLRPELHAALRKKMEASPQSVHKAGFSIPLHHKPEIPRLLPRIDRKWQSVAAAAILVLLFWIGEQNNAILSPAGVWAVEDSIAMYGGGNQQIPQQNTSTSYYNEMGVCNIGQNADTIWPIDSFYQNGYLRKYRQ